MRLHRHLMLALWIGLGSAAAFAQAVTPVSPDDLNAAVQAAKAPTAPSPYPLRGPSKPVTRGAPLDPEVARTLDPNKILTFGAVYTPFIRGAMLARKAADAGRPFGLADIPRETQDALTYVLALPWERADADGPDRLVDVNYVILTPSGSTDRAKIIEPAWVKADTGVLRTSLGLPYQIGALWQRSHVTLSKPTGTSCSCTPDRSMRSEWRSGQRMSRHGGRHIAGASSAVRRRSVRWMFRP